MSFGGFLKQSTAVDVLLGPFVDKGDGDTEETLLTIEDSDVQLSKNGQGAGDKNDDTTCAHDKKGFYNCELNDTDTNTVGQLTAFVHVSGALAVRMDYQVVEEAIYAALYAASAVGFDANQRVNVGQWLSQAVTLSGNNRPDVNIDEISDDTTAPVNLEAMYDGTGYTDDRAPSSRAQVDGIGASSGAALNFVNEGDNVDAPIKSITFEGVETSGTNASVNSEDDTYHNIDDSENIDIVYQFDVGGGRTAVEVTWKGYLTGNNDEATIQVYNGSGWDTISTINGKTQASNDVKFIPLLLAHTGTGSDLGKVFIRIECAAQSDPSLFTDQLLVEAINIGQSIGYADGAIWVDTSVNGTAGTEAFVNGVADNPVDSWADALSLSSTLKIKRFHIIAGSSITLSAASDAYNIFGIEYMLALGGRSIAATSIAGATVSGTGIGADAVFSNCKIGTCTLAASTLKACALTSTLTLSAAATYLLDACYSGVSGAGTPIIDFGGGVANTALNMRHYSGGITINNKDANGTDTMSLEGHGQLIVAASSSGAIELRGHFKVTNTGGATITLAKVTVGTNDDKTGYAIGSGGIAASSFATGAIDAAAIAANAIGASEIAEDAIGSSELATSAANDIADALLDRVNGIETGYTPRQMLRIVFSALAAKVSGAETTSMRFRDVGDTKDRITATVDVNGNRTAVSLDTT